MNETPKDPYGFDDVHHDDLVLLESLVSSPVFGALKRAIGKYRDACMAELVSASDTHKLYQTQGRVLGLSAIENLPMILVKRKQAREKVEAAKREDVRELEQRKERIFNPTLPPVVKRPPRKK